MKKMGLNTLPQKPSVGPKAPISRAATMTIVTLPSMMGVRPILKPLAIAPSSVLPLPSSSLMRSAVITLASTPIPIPRMIPAIPGRVSVEPLNTVK